MSEMKLNFKGPLGVVLGVIVIVIVIYVKFFMGYIITDKDKEFIRAEIKQLRLSEMSKISDATIKQYKKSGKYLDNSKEILALSKEPKIIKIDSKKNIMGGAKIKVTYTVDGKVPENDGGIRYFNIQKNNRKKNSNIRKRVHLREITVDDFNQGMF